VKRPGGAPKEKKKNFPSFLCGSGRGLGRRKHLRGEGSGNEQMRLALQKQKNEVLFGQAGQTGGVRKRSPHRKRRGGGGEKRKSLGKEKVEEIMTPPGGGSIVHGERWVRRCELYSRPRPKKN